MKGKIIGILLVIGLFLPTTYASALQYEGTLDQSTPDDDITCMSSNLEMAQRFKPKLPILTEVELGLSKFENLTGEVEVSIRQTRDGKNLVSRIISADDLPYRDFTWILIDFENLEVKPNHKYYIVVSPGVERNVGWFMANQAPYKQGLPWYHSIIKGDLDRTPWLPGFMVFKKPFDFTFRTYGIEN
jgi:hypothetical protein